jgi:O-antigen ligase
LNSSAIWQMSFGLIIVFVMLAVAAGAKRTVSIGVLLVLVPFQTIDTRYGSSSILIAYALAGVLLLNGGLKVRQLATLSLIVLAYFVSLGFADRGMFTRHVIFMFQFFSCFVVYLLAYNYAILVKDERSVVTILLLVNVLAIAYCGLQLSVGPGERFIPFGIDEFKFNLNRHPGDPRLVGPFDNPGSTAGYFALMTLVCAVEFMYATGKRRLLVCGIVGFNMLGLVATGNRAGFLILLAMAPLLLFAYRRELGMKRIVQYSLGGAAALALMATIAVTFTDFNLMFNRMETVTETEGGIPTTRSEGWPVAIEKIKQRPLVGEGPYFWTAEDAEDIEQLQYEFDEGGEIDTAFDHYPHSLYLYLLRTVGLVGLVAVLAFFVRAWFTLRSALRAERVGYRASIVRLGLFLIPTFLISQITLEFNRPSTMDYAQFIFMLVGLLVGTSDRLGVATSERVTDARGLQPNQPTDRSRLQPAG